MNPGRDAVAASPQTLLAHAEWVRRLARALVRADDADDVVQQTWAQALVAPRPSRNLRGWLGAIARNVVRRNVRDVATRARLDPLAPTPARAPDPVQAVARAELHRRVVDTVLALDEPYRSTLVLRFFDELPADAIARAAGVPVETVRTRVKRGLAQLRERLGGEFAHEGRSLEEGLAMLWIPSITRGGAGAGAAAPAGAAVGAGLAAMSSTSKVLLAAAAAVVVIVAAWRLTTPSNEAHAREVVAQRAAGPPPAPPPALAAPAVTTATRAVEELADPTPSDAGDAVAGVAANFDVVGRVVDAKGAPVVDAVVLLGDANSTWFRPRTSGNEALCTVAAGLLEDRTKPEKFGSRGTRSAADGNFRFDNVDGDHAYVIAALHEVAGIGRAPAPAHGAKEAVVVTLAPMIVVHGRITEVDGRIPAGAKVDIDVKFSASEGGNGHALVGSDGRFRCFWTKIDSATFTAKAADGRESEKVRLDFRAGDPRVRDVALVLAATGGGVCRGRLVDARGAPIDLKQQLLPRLTDWERADSAARSVRLFTCMGESAPAPAFEMGSMIERGTIDLDHATYEAPLSNDTRFIALVVRGRTLASAAITRANAGDHGPDLVVDLAQLPAAPTAAAVEVHLLDSTTGGPYSGPVAELELTSVFADPLQPTVAKGVGSHESGRDARNGIVWFDGVHPGQCTLTLKVQGMAPIHREFEVVARAEPYRIEIRLAPAIATLRGQVVGPDGQPLAKAHVRVLERSSSGLDATNLSPTLTNADGRFIFEKLASGEGLVIVHALPFAPAVVPVKLAADGDAGTIALAAGGRVVVTVARPRNPDQSSFADVHAFRTADSVPLVEPGWEGSVDWKTATRLELVLPPGRATLDVTLIDGTKLHKEVDVVAGKAQELTID